MILPQKHIGLSESLFGLGGFILQLIDKPIATDDLWKSYERYNNSVVFPFHHTFDNFIVALDYLYLIGAIFMDDRGCIFYEINKAQC